MNILHLSDLHINNPSSIEENLRNDRYKEFIDDLYESFMSTELAHKGPIDYLFVTGDFVDKGKVENFSHAKKILHYIIEKFKIPVGQTFVCIGNHDIVREFEKNGDAASSIKDYLEFEAEFNGNRYQINKIGERGSIIKAGKDYILILDAVSNTGGSDRPAINIPDEFIDSVASKWVKETIPNDSNLFILSHYPLKQSKRDMLDYEEPQWTDRHLWTKGIPLLKRIEKIRAKHLGKTIWFFGDAHLPDLSFDEKSPSVVYVMTGQFGGQYLNAGVSKEGRGYKIYHQATYLNLEGNQLRRVVFSYGPEAFNFNAHTGVWTGESSSTEFPQISPLIVPIKQEKDNFIVPVGTSLEDEIFDQVKNQELYKFGKYITSENLISLGWISINNLFENTVLLSNGIDKISEWLQKNVITNNGNEILLGCGFWGGILAANVAIRSSINSYTFSAFLNSQNCSEEESIDYLLKRIDHLNKVRRIILFTDVISSGNTLLTVKSKFEKLTKESFEWIAICIFIDSNNISKEFQDSFKVCGALCTKLKMPVIDRVLLPDDDIFPSALDLTEKL